MNRHVSDIVSLIFGIVFVGLAAGWMLNQWLDVTMPSAGWVAASALVLFGALGLITTVVQRRGGTPAG
jgi:hypothetical protein